jgi:magnesium chelatase subunit D
MTPIYPFSAVIGQERLKLALLLCAIDPSIGGVLVRGPRGVAKTTLARAFAQLLPGDFVELPLGATEERLTGTLDLKVALERQGVQFSPGLLSRAHEGVLYVDEANLLPDSLVDLLLDASATGRNVVERDGVSHVHPARFVLVGTMNPEEGELRPQFVDRFGLCVTADGELALERRTQIVLARLEFEREPAAFLARFEREQKELVERCRVARERLPRVALAGPGLARVSELCHSAKVDGVRADLAMLRAARAHAAWLGRDGIGVEDVDSVAELALAHRRRALSDPPPAAPAGGSEPAPGSGSGGRRTAGAEASKLRGDGAEGSTARGFGDRGALPPEPHRALASVRLPASLEAAFHPRAERRGAPKPNPIRPRRRGPRPSRAGIDWFATLSRGPRPALSDLRYRIRRGLPEGLWLLAVDCSASMLRSGALSIAKGFASSLAARALGQGRHVALISFGGRGARTELVSRALSTELTHRTLERALLELPAGGGTPLRRALETAFAVSRRPAYAGSATPARLVLLTDGRTREDVRPLARRTAALQTIVVDCERGPLRLERALRLASELGATYLRAEPALPEKPDLGSDDGEKSRSRIRG